MQANENQKKTIQANPVINPIFQKESIINLENLLNKEVRIKFIGGREIQGLLIGYDSALNMMLDNSVEFLRGFFYFFYFIIKNH